MVFPFQLQKILLKFSTSLKYKFSLPLQLYEYKLSRLNVYPYMGDEKYV